MPKVQSAKKKELSEVKKESVVGSGGGWNNGQLFGTEITENTFQGAGFKDKEKALETLRLLEDRDVTYQYNIVNSMYNRAKVILKRTTDKEKVRNLTESIAVFESWIDDYKSRARAKENLAYLPLETVEAYEKLAEHYAIEQNGFLNAYKEVDGDLKKLRSKKVAGLDVTWDVHRNRSLKPLIDNMNNEKTILYETKEPLSGLPTKEHTELIMWGYSSDASKVKRSTNLVRDQL